MAFEPAMAPNTADHWENLWQIWNVRIAVVSSLVLEIILLFFGPLRKRSAKVAFVWWAYLLSPTICSYGLGFFFAREDYGIKPSEHHPQQLLVLWGSFLLLHIAGPDTITSISIQQNELWKSQYLYVFANSLLFGITFVIACIEENSPVSISAIIVCVVGIKRCHDWVMSLKFSRQVGGEMQLPKKLWLTEMATRETGDYQGELTTLQVLQHAYTFFTRYKGLIVDFSFSFWNCSESRQIFLELTPRDAFRVVERELNFFYEVLYTKAWSVKNWPAYVWRFLEIIALFVALSLSTGLKGYRDHDRAVTWLLLFGSIFIEVSTVIMVASTDLSIAFLRFHIGSSSLAKPLEKIRATSETSCWFPKKIQEYITRSWSNSLCQYNLIKHSMYPCLRRFGRYVKDWVTSNAKTEGSYYGKTVKFDEDLKGLITEQLKMKSQMADIPMVAWEIQQAKGEWTLRHENCEHLVTQIGDRDFDQILLTWHVATDLCFHTDDDNSDGQETCKDRNLSRCLSDYMLYLLMKQPKMMSTVSARGFKRYKDTCAEVHKIFSEKKIRKMTLGGEISRLNLACKSICSGDTGTSPNISSKDGSMSVLMDACNLAEELNRLGSVRKWEVLSKVWVEMLCYAASHCKASAHMEEIRLGGQLITIVWLLMVHFGLVK